MQQTWVLVLVGIVLLGGIIILVSVTSSSSSALPELPLDKAISSDRVKGPLMGKLTLIEYSDFQCPACATYRFLLKELMEEFNQDLQFVYRHFPLKSIHQNATPAARAAEAAGRQGKFWEMHDLIFQHQNDWKESKEPKTLFAQYAQELQLDMSKFQGDQETEEIRNKVEADYRSGNRAGVNATPTFFLNGKKLSNPRSPEEFKNIIKQALVQ